MDIHEINGYPLISIDINFYGYPWISTDLHIYIYIYMKQINEERIYVSLNERGENSHTAQGTALDRALGYFEFDLVLKHVT